MDFNTVAEKLEDAPDKKEVLYISLFLLVKECNRFIFNLRKKGLENLWNRDRRKDLSLNL